MAVWHQLILHLLEPISVERESRGHTVVVGIATGVLDRPDDIFLRDPGATSANMECCALAGIEDV